MPQIQHLRQNYTLNFQKLITFADGSEIYWRINRDLNQVVYKVFYAKQQTTKEHYSIKRKTFDRALEEFGAVVEKVSRSIEATLKYKAEAKAQRQRGAQRLETGSIICGTWGYDQTNVEFYEVTAISATGKTCTIQKIKHDEKPTGNMSGKCFPLPGQYVRQPLKNKRIVNDQVSLDFCVLQLWDGRELHASHYA